MLFFILKRIFYVLPTILGVVTIVFFLLHLIPGDPVDIMLGEKASAFDRSAMRDSLGLNDPIYVQYGRFLGNLVRGDLGTSIFTGEPVTKRIWAAFPATFQLSLSALLVALMISLPAGWIAAARRDSFWDSGTMVVSLLGLSIPSFWLGPLLILVFSFQLNLFPISGREGLLSVVLPALTLGTGMAAILARMTRATLVEVIQEDFVRTAKAKGLSFSQIWIKHVFRNALLPILTIVGLQAGALLSGSIITEKIFSWPGLGLELIEAIERRDYPVVQGCVFVIAIFYVLINFLVDLSYGWIDPRVRLLKKVGE